jgi:hypothetical protein
MNLIRKLSEKYFVWIRQFGIIKAMKFTRFVGGRPNYCMELTALESGGSQEKRKKEFALLLLGERLLAAAHVGR